MQHEPRVSMKPDFTEASPEYIEAVTRFNDHATELWNFIETHSSSRQSTRKVKADLAEALNAYCVVSHQDSNASSEYMRGKVCFNAGRMGLSGSSYWTLHHNLDIYRELSLAVWELSPKSSGINA